MNEPPIAPPADPAGIACSALRVCDLPEELLQVLDASVIPHRLAAGETLWREGEVSDSGMVFVVRGRLEALKNNDFGKSSIVLGLLGPGAIIGLPFDEKKRPKAATIKATEAAELMQLPDAAFERIVEQHPRLAIALIRRIHRELSQRLNFAADRIAGFF